MCILSFVYNCDIFKCLLLVSLSTIIQIYLFNITNSKTEKLQNQSQIEPEMSSSI